MMQGSKYIVYSVMGGLAVRKNRDKSNMQVYCNRCGRELNTKHGVVTEGVAGINICWDYFSQNDGSMHMFDLCEPCYFEIISDFKLPVEVKQLKELI